MAYDESDYGYEASARRRLKEVREKSDRLPPSMTAQEHPEFDSEAEGKAKDKSEDKESTGFDWRNLPGLGRLFGQAPRLREVPPIKLEAFRDRKEREMLDAHSPMQRAESYGPTVDYLGPPQSQDSTLSPRTASTDGLAELALEVELLVAQRRADAVALLQRVASACRRGDVESLERIWTEAGPKPAINDGSLTKPDSQQFLPLAVAIHAKSSACVEFLLSKGADPNAMDGAGRPAWHAVNRHCDIDMAKRMFATGADPSIRNVTTGGNALHGCVEYGTPEMIKLLRTYGVDPNQGDKYDRSPIHFLSNRRSDTADQALSGGARLDAMKEPLAPVPKLG